MVQWAVGWKLNYPPQDCMGWHEPDFWIDSILASVRSQLDSRGSTMESWRSHLFTDGSKNKLVQVHFSGNKKFLVPMPPNRKASFDLVLSPPVFTHMIRVEIREVYSQENNGLALVRLWHTVHLQEPILYNPNSLHLATHLEGVGLWGPWEFCPPGHRAIAWQGKHDMDEGITGM